MCVDLSRHRGGADAPLTGVEHHSLRVLAPRHVGGDPPLGPLRVTLLVYPCMRLGVAVAMMVVPDVYVSAAITRPDWTYIFSEELVGSLSTRLAER